MTRVASRGKIITVFVSFIFHRTWSRLILNVLAQRKFQQHKKRQQYFEIVHIHGTRRNQNQRILLMTLYTKYLVFHLTFKKGRSHLFAWGIFSVYFLFSARRNFWFIFVKLAMVFGKVLMFRASEFNEHSEVILHYFLCMCNESATFRAPKDGLFSEKFQCIQC